MLFHGGLTDNTLEEIRQFEGNPDNITYDWTMPSQRGGTFVFHSREVLNYRKHLLKAGGLQFYAERWRGYLHPKLQKIFAWRIARELVKTGLAGWFLKLIERLTPPQSDVLSHLRNLNPDIVAVTPLNQRYSSMELEYLKAAVTLGVPSVLLMGSWDHITSKGIYHIVPDVSLIWNEEQVQEMWEHHRIPRDNLRIVGAPTLDHWLDFDDPTPREIFCKNYRLRPDDSIIMYCCSSNVIIGSETASVTELRKILDESADERLKRTQIIFRPHPKNFKIYEKLQLPGVTVIPRGDVLYGKLEGQRIFYDTLMHSSLVFGINTSAMLDAMLLGKPVIALYKDQYTATQVEMYHFNSLLHMGAIEFAKTPDEIRKAILDIFEGRDVRKEKRERFIRDFIRPRGIKISANEVIADEIEDILKSSKHSLLF